MDKYVIRTPRPCKQTRKEKSPKQYKQVKLENLKGVVVIEDLEKAKLILEKDDTSAALKVDTLKRLSAKQPSKEILIKTSIGKVVHKLCHHSDSAVASTAKSLYRSWRNHIVSKVDRPVIEVTYDAKTQQLRSKARDLILNALNEGHAEDCCNSEFLKNGNNANHLSIHPKSPCSASGQEMCLDRNKKVAEYIEREVFSLTKNKVNGVYKRTNRKIIFVLKYQNDIKSDLLKSKLSVPELAKTYLQV